MPVRAWACGRTSLIHPSIALEREPQREKPRPAGAQEPLHSTHVQTENYQQGWSLIMSILTWIVVGIVPGWLAERITGRSHGLITNLVWHLCGR
jgi:hypothetical protein